MHARRLARTILGLALAWSVLARPARAHQVAAPLAEWDHFATATANCQRVLGRAVGLCVWRAVNAQNRCLAAEMKDAPCDRAAMQAAELDTRSQIVRLIDRKCGSEDLQHLRYSGRDDAVADVLQACRETETAATSAIWGPVIVGGRAAAAPAAERACITANARIASRLLRLSTRLQQRALNRIAGGDLNLEEKDHELAAARAMVDRVRQRAQARLLERCPGNAIESIYGRDAATVLNGVLQRGECLNGYIYIVDGATSCPPPVCGNGIVESGEECDDGNDHEGDACSATCTKAECDVFSNTYDLIQKAIFENRGCTAELCHTSDSAAGGLDLSAGASYADLIDVPADSAEGFKRVDPGNSANSLLWVNVAAKVLADEVRAPLRAMPLGPDALSMDEVEALRLWIESGGATRTETVPGTTELLDTCAGTRSASPFNS